MRYALEGHIAITASSEVEKILASLQAQIPIKFFRYLKLFEDGSRIVLSNHPDILRYLYGDGKYQETWYDGAFPEYLTDGWHYWCVNSVLHRQQAEQQIEKEINLFNLFHGLSFVHNHYSFCEVFSFDGDSPELYNADKKILLRFMMFFKQEGAELITRAHEQKIILPKINPLPKVDVQTIRVQDRQTAPLHIMPLNRYYLSGQMGECYITRKEAKHLYWLALGKSNDDIAFLENCSLKTVQRHFENIKFKLGYTKQTQLVHVALTSGLIDTITLEGSRNAWNST